VTEYDVFPCSECNVMSLCGPPLGRLHCTLSINVESMLSRS